MARGIISDMTPEEVPEIDTEQTLKKISVNLPMGLYQELVMEADDFDLLVSEYVRNILRTRLDDPELPEMWCPPCGNADVPVLSCPECGTPMDELPENGNEDEDVDEDEPE